MTKVNRKQALKRMAATAGLVALHKFSNAITADELDKNEKVTSSFPGKAIDWKSAALVVVDMQTDFVRAGAPLEVSSALNTVPAQKSLINIFHKNNLPVVFTKFISHPHYYLLWEWSPQCQPPTKCCWKGHQRYYKDINANRDCTEVIDELQPISSDIIVEKFGYGAFHETTLDKTLHSLGVTTLVITGTVTQICVEETAREAFHHGYRTYIAEDGVSSFAPDLHAATLKNFAMKFGWVTKSESIISEINSVK